MSSTGRYLKPAYRVSSPGVIISIHVQSTNVSDGIGQKYTEREFAYAVAAVTKKTRGRWCKPIIRGFRDKCLLHSWLRTIADKRKRNYCISNCASNTLWLTEWFKYAESHGIMFVPDKETMDKLKNLPIHADTIVVNRMCLKGKPDIFSYRDSGKSYMWLSLLQYYDTSNEILEQSFGEYMQADHRRYRGSGCERERVAYYAILYMTVFRELCKWWDQSTKAPFGLTAGQLAMGVLRTYVKSQAISSHNNEDAGKLESIACYGGRQTLWYVGAIGNNMARIINESKTIGSRPIPVLQGPIRCLDVVSMYAYLLRDMVYPCKLVRTTGPITPKELHEYSSYYGCIAHVRIQTKLAEYPLRKEKYIGYPIGEFQTVLAGPEIEDVFSTGKICEVYNASIYILGTPFKDAAAFLLRTRCDATRNGNKARASLAKLLCNSMAGKFNQRKGNWLDRPEYTGIQQWGEWVERNADTKTARRFRAIAGLVQEYVAKDSKPGPYAFAFAYLTAYGRVLMRRVRECFDSETVIQQDTDGIWFVGDLPEKKLQAVCGLGNEPGQLRIKEESQNGYFIGPQHYFVDSGWILSGFNNATPDIRTGNIEYSYTINPLATGGKGLGERIRLYSNTTRLPDACERNCTNSWGWVAPQIIDPVARDIAIA